jgi:hypothetical protein
MRWTARQPFVPPSLLDHLDRVRLRRAARRYAAQGWVVVRRRRTPAVLLATGIDFDVLEVPAALGRRALAVPGPVAVTAGGRWMFFVGPGLALRPELDDRTDVVRHGAGSWVPAAPSRLPEGPVRWAVPPERTQWLPGDAGIVQDRLADALGALHRHQAARHESAMRKSAPQESAPQESATHEPAMHLSALPRPAVPRQVSTGRRSV